ncbi:MAG TPA: LCP family protein [Actinomycetota bacterium]|nr:LCP family protein [Actinomycetota bacterium]
MQPLLKSGRSSRRTRLPRGVVRALLGLLALVVLVGLVAGGILLYAQFKVKGNQEEVQVAEQTANEPMNVLVLGSDSREALTAEQQQSMGNTDVVPGRRADTIMLLHLDQDREKAVLVHFPRDLRVEDPDGKMVKINGIYSLGPDAMVATVSEFTGMPVHHYLEVDFNGFNRIADAVGGVQVYFERPVRDQDSGLNQPAGCVTIEGDQALAFVRARKIDDDFGRIRRQQLFMKLMADKIATPGVVLRPDRVLSLVNVFSQAVRYDTELSLGDIRTIGLRLRRFNSGNLDMRVVPSAGARIDGVDYVVANELQTSALFSALANGEPLPDYGRTGVSAIDPADVRVSLLNGTDVDRLAANEAEALKAKGFQVVETGNTTPHPVTTVYYAEGFQDQGRLLANTYGGDPKPLPATIVAAGQVAVVLGQDFAVAHPQSSPGPGATAAPPGTVAPPPPPAAPAPPPAETRPLVHACDE